MDINKEIKNVYSLFSEGNFKDAQKLNNKILAAYPNQMYAKRYQSMLEKKLSNGENGDVVKVNSQKVGISEKIAKVRGKSLKCSHCLAKIPFSGLNSQQQNAIKTGNYNNLEIKCPYCHIQFVLQKRKAKSILGLKIGEKATIEGKEYRTTGYVQYRGKWYEGRYSGQTDYLEWLLLGEDNTYYYFSEGKSYDDGDIEYEFELSKKVIPNFSIPSNFNENVKVSIVSVYGENSKKYSVGDKVELGEFSSGGKKYVVEKEGVGSQMEAGVYELTSLSREKAFKLFGKKDFGRRVASKNSGISGIKKVFAVIGLSVFISFFTYLVIPPYLSSEGKVELGKTYYLNGEYKKYNGTATCSDEGEYWTCYSYTKTKGLSFLIKDQQDIDLFNKLRTENISDEKLSKIINSKLYSFSGDYSKIDWLKGIQFYVLFSLFFLIIFIFSKD